MKKLYFLLFLILNTCVVQAQDITGQWYGMLKEMNLRIVLNVNKTASEYTATLDSPDQGATGIPVTAITFKNDILNFTMTNLGVVSVTTLKNNTFTGYFSQNGFKIPLELTREKIVKKEINRPQTPKRPFTYYEEEVTFKNEVENINLSGTLTLPKKEGKFPVVILITGSGPQNRDEEIAGHKPFLVIADYLTKNGIGVLRYDERGVGESSGDFSTATSEDFANDVKHAVTYLKTREDIDSSKIGLIGHSEGGLIAPLVASSTNNIAFIVLLAGPGLRGDKLLLTQQEAIARSAGTAETAIENVKKENTKIFDFVLKAKNTTELTETLKDYVTKNAETIVPKGMTTETFINTQIKSICTPWMLYFIKHDPAKVLKNVHCPVLAINGEKDLQVLPDQNLNAINAALKKGGNKLVTIKKLPALNHLFQECTTGSPTEYTTIEQTIAPTVLQTITHWIKEQL